MDLFISLRACDTNESLQWFKYCWNFCQWIPTNFSGDSQFQEIVVLYIFTRLKLW